MKKTIFPLFLILSLLAFPASAQVKQVFKVVSYPDGKPLAGATNSLYGNSLKTNVQGIAVATLPEERKGDYLAMGDWILDGYLDIGLLKKVDVPFQGKDTLYTLMVNEKEYREAQTDLFLKYFRRAYNTEVEQMMAFSDSARIHPENSDAYAQTLIGYASHIFTTAIRQYYKDAVRTTPYVLSRMCEEVRMAVEPFLQEGDLNGAASAVKALIKKDDVSRENLERIDDYLHFRDLNLVSADGVPSSDYSRILYENDFSDYSIGEHLLNLLNEFDWKEADSITAKEKAKDRIPRYSFLFEPSVGQYVRVDQHEQAVAAIQRYIDRSKESFRKYPNANSYWMLVENRNVMMNMLYEDTTRFNLQLDSLLADCHRFFELEANGDFYRNKSIMEIYLNILERLNQGVSSHGDEKIQELGLAVYRAAKENYALYPSDVYLQLQYAVMCNEFLLLTETRDEDTLLQEELVDSLLVLNVLLSKTFPEMMSVNQLVLQSQVLGKMIYGTGTDEEVLRLFRDFKRGFTFVDSLYHGVFTETVLDFCMYASVYLHDQNRTATVGELDAFIELLMAMRAQENARPFDSEKALSYNRLAESFYNAGNYTYALQMYDSAADYFLDAVQKDPKQWIPFMRNYLQKGDAYVRLEEYAKAKEAYMQVLVHETQIPSDLKAQYYNMKGSSFYDIGDVYYLYNDKKSGAKMYKLAEQCLKRSMEMGDSTACFALGELYLKRAVRNYKPGGEKKMVAMVDKSVRTYERYPMDRPYDRYEQAVFFLENYYNDEKDSVRYVRELKSLTEYYRRFASLDSSYLYKYIGYSHKLAIGLGVSNEAVKYAEYEVHGYRMALSIGDEPDLSYMQALYRLAKYNSEEEANEKSIELYEECLPLNEEFYKDTATADYARNAYYIYSSMIDVYTDLAQKCEKNGDDKESVKWYEKAARTCDTMILVAEKYMEFTEEAYKNYTLGSMFYQSALICKELDWKSTAISQLDSANGYLLKMQGGEYWSEVEMEVMRNLYMKGSLATDSYDLELAKECYKELVDYASKSDGLYDKSQNGWNMAVIYYYEAVEKWMDILENRENGADTETIRNLKKQRDALATMMKGKKK